ncbi:hypothetical protein V1478_008861 [Vespula squamosa]|uniref:Uncharacterized protein n=1 Tax=Vespula squamosa TaxID=30214 RepID=A0ABD2AUS1_VESSQ
MQVLPGEWLHISVVQTICKRSEDDQRTTLLSHLYAVFVRTSSLPDVFRPVPVSSISIIIYHIDRYDIIHQFVWTTRLIAVIIYFLLVFVYKLINDSSNHRVNDSSSHRVNDSTIIQPTSRHHSTYVEGDECFGAIAELLKCGKTHMWSYVVTAYHHPSLLELLLIRHAMRLVESQST